MEEERRVELGGVGWSWMDCTAELWSLGQAARGAEEYFVRFRASTFHSIWRGDGSLQVQYHFGNLNIKSGIASL
jgi:hypothetical protein